jgi:ferric-dicitrate binding protein FerR (iron transport regulator)
MNEQNDQQLAELLRLAGRRPRPSDETAARVRAAVRAEWEAETRGRRRMRNSFRAAAAVAAMAAGVFVYRGTREVAPIGVTPPVIVARVAAISGSASMNERPLAVGATMAAGSAIETEAGSALSLDWTGASLRLDSASRVRLISQHEVTLDRGAVFFSSLGARAGITIRTPYGEVRDIGTQFEVRLDSDAMRVRVREGRVDLRRGAIVTSASGGEELTARAAGNVARAPLAPNASVWQWVERAAPPLQLEGMTLDDVVRRTAREKGLAVRYDTPAREVTLHGATPLAPEEALDAAVRASGLTWKIAGDTLVIGRRR